MSKKVCDLISDLRGRGLNLSINNIVATLFPIVPTLLKNRRSESSLCNITFSNQEDGNLCDIHLHNLVQQILQDRCTGNDCQS